MAEKIDKVRVAPGRLIRAKNTDKPKFSNAKSWYYFVWVEDANGKNERCLAFTERELNLAADRASKNKEDWPEKGLIQDLLD